MSPETVSDAAIIDAIETAIEEGDTDAWDGGVPPTEVAERTGLVRSTASSRLAALAETGNIQRVWGIGEGPQEGPRVSYRPETGGSKN